MNVWQALIQTVLWHHRTDSPETYRSTLRNMQKTWGITPGVAGGLTFPEGMSEDELATIFFYCLDHFTGWSDPEGELALPSAFQVVLSTVAPQFGPDGWPLMIRLARNWHKATCGKESFVRIPLPHLGEDLLMLACYDEQPPPGDARPLALDMDTSEPDGGMTLKDNFERNESTEGFLGRRSDIIDLTDKSRREHPDQPAD